MNFLLGQKNKQRRKFPTNYYVDLFSKYHKYEDELFLFFYHDRIQKLSIDDTTGIHIANLLTKIARANGLADEIIIWIRRLAISLDHAFRQGSVYLSLENFAKAYQVDECYIRQSLFFSTFLGEDNNCLGDNLNSKTDPKEYPFIIDSSNRIYFSYLFTIEKRLAKGIFFLLSKKQNLLKDEHIQKKIQCTLAELYFLKSNFLEKKEKIDWQIMASLLIFKSDLLIISGGPGTGKTTTVSKIVSVLLSILPNTSIAFCAPTGKAAKRLESALTEQIVKWPKQLQNSFYRNNTFEVLTVHRLLGVSEAGVPRYHGNNVLRYDLIIVDEASMLDQVMACYLIEALNNNSKLILLGDKDQLSSVNPGAIFSELSAISIIDEQTFFEISSFLHLEKDEIANVKDNEFSLLEICNDEDNAVAYEKASQRLLIKLSNKERHNCSKGNQEFLITKYQEYVVLKDCCISLEKNYRFDKLSQIGEFASAIKNSSFHAVLNSCQILDLNINKIDLNKGENQVNWFLDDQENLSFYALVNLIEGYSFYFDTLIRYLSNEKVKRYSNFSELFLAFDHFRILCAIRDGKRGILDVNKFVTSYLYNLRKIIFPKKIKNINYKKNISEYIEHFYINTQTTPDLILDVGVPIMITENNYNLQLFNGDIGILLPRKATLDKSDLNIAAFFPPIENVTSIGKEKDGIFANHDYREFPINILPTYESAFAMTIHKSQGSEFDSVAIVLPKEGDRTLQNENISKELLYTAVTRARSAVSIFCSRIMMQNMINKKSDRESSLMARLREWFIWFRDKKV